MAGAGGRRYAVLALGCAALAAALVSTVPPSVPPSVESSSLGAGAVTFEPNLGQAGAGADFVARTPSALLEVSAASARLGDVALSFVGGDVEATGAGAEALPGTLNYLTGDDPSRWHTGVLTYGRVVYPNVYDGIDVAWYGRDGQPEYDLVVSPGSDIGRVRIGFSGVDAVRVNREGDAVAGPLVQRRPVAYQETDAGRRPVEARFVATGRAEVAVRVGDYDRRVPLVVDPVLVYSSYLGGQGQDTSTDIAVDGAGSAYVVATTNGSDWPVVPGAYQPARKIGYDAVVTKFAPDGKTLVYSTYVGGNDADQGHSIAVDGAGNAYVTGSTFSADFPVVNAAQPTRRGPTDAFVTKLNASGTALVYSTFYGGDDDETAYRITVDGSGNAYVTGETDSTTFPTRNPIQAQNAGDDDTFLVKLNTAGSPVYATYLGGNGIDYPYGLGVDAGGNVVMGGFTTSDNFPTLNAVDATKDTHADAFMARINSAGSALTYSTYLGGTFGDVVYDLVVDGAGNAYATGSTESRNFPTTPGAYQVEGVFGAFVFKMSPGGSLVFSTYLGTATDGTGIGIDPLGRIIVTGEAGSAFPLVNPTQPVYGDNDDGFVSVLNASGSALLFSTYIGGSGYDFGHGLAADGSGAYIVGQTTSHDFPLKNPFQTSAYGSGGIYDLWVAKFAFDDPAPAVQGRTWYDDGSSLKGGPAATTIRVYGTGAVPGTAYRLVLARGDNLRRCADNVVTLSGTNRTASAAGFIGATIGTIPTGTPPGQYHICFKATTGATVMSPVLFNVS